MSNTKDYNFNVETLEAGQRHKYGDSHYRYIVQSKLPLHYVKAFCTGVLKKAIPNDVYKKEREDDFNNYFRSHYTMKVIFGDNDPFSSDTIKIIEYYVIEPSTH